MEQRTLLILDASAEDRATLLRHLRRDVSFEYRAFEASCSAEALAHLSTTKPDCVVLDSSLPDGQALEFLRAAAAPSGRLPFPAVVLSSVDNREAAVAMLKAGAQDYLVKSDAGADAARLAIEKAIYQARAERRIQEQREELTRLYEAARASNDALRTANAAKDDFLGMLSHELRTPLTPVLSLVSSTLEDSRLTPDLRETFALIQRNVQLEARLIDDLLDLTQIAGGRLKLEGTPVDLHCCLQAALEVSRAAFDEKRISIHTDLRAVEPMVVGEFARLTQMFWNVLKNAAKFTGKNGHVSITTTNAPGRVSIEIRDDGMGIEPDRLNLIFGAFGAHRPPANGTGLGLGLAITRAIVEAHGGEIRVQSEGRERGAVFHLSLPAASAPPAGPEPAEAATNAKRRTILVVEDHEDTRRVLSRALRRKGFGVTTAGSVTAACDQFAASHPDLVVCDIGLPDGTGWELLEKLRPHGPVRAIAVSGYGMDNDVAKSREIGFVAHLTKPVDFPRLERLIAETLAPAAH